MTAATPHYIEIGRADAPSVVFAHGWARTHRDFIPTAEALAPRARSILLDLPGFGATPRPDEAWGTADYADHLATSLESVVTTPFIWVGHSFGGRIGLRMAVRRPELLRAMVLVASAGVPRELTTLEQAKRRYRQTRFKLEKRLAKDQAAVAALEENFGSADYVQSRKTGLREIFLRTINEDQSADLGRIQTPTTLIYGAEDTETPPEIGRRLHTLISGSEFVLCPEFDHISVLERGRHQIALAIAAHLQEAAA